MTPDCEMVSKLTRPIEGVGGPSRRRVLALLTGAVLMPDVGRAGATDLYPRRDVSPREVIRRKNFPDVALRTHHGKLVRFYDDLVKDRTVVINFMYVNCADGTCPLATYSLKMVQEQLKDRVGKDIFFYSITLDPERDSLQALRNYADVHRVGPGWTFLRAERRELDVLRRGLGFYDRDPRLDAQMSNHSAMLRYGNEPRFNWGMVPAQRDPRAIARAVLQVAES